MIHNTSAICPTSFQRADPTGCSTRRFPVDAVDVPVDRASSSRWCSVVPPHTPYVSPKASACRRHSAWTGQVPQRESATSSRALRRMPRSSSGAKNRSGLTSRQAARSCHAHSSANGGGVGCGVRLTMSPFWAVRRATAARCPTCSPRRLSSNGAGSISDRSRRALQTTHPGVVAAGCSDREQRPGVRCPEHQSAL
jgi:hypothetical protein